MRIRQITVVARLVRSCPAHTGVAEDQRALNIAVAADGSENRAGMTAFTSEASQR